MTGHEKILQYFLFVSLFINVMLNFCLIPKIGITGAAISSALSFILCNSLALVYIKKRFGFWTFEKNLDFSNGL